VLSNYLRYNVLRIPIVLRIFCSKFKPISIGLISVQSDHLILNIICFIVLCLPKSISCSINTSHNLILSSLLHPILFSSISLHRSSGPFPELIVLCTKHLIAKIKSHVSCCISLSSISLLQL